MNDDNELLELAAKAAGITIDKSPYNGGGLGNTGFDVSGNAVLDWHNNTTWNPLSDDGAALRLAVKLGLGNRVLCLSIGGEKSACEFNYVAHGGDAYAATRRAIVIAAAAIGKEMP